MLSAGQGLSQVKTEALVPLLRVLHRGELRFPLTIDELSRVGLQHTAGELLATLRQLDEAGVRAVLVAVLAERRHLSRG